MKNEYKINNLIFFFFFSYFFYDIMAGLPLFHIY